jgi:predicted metal-dependent phosphoesterase TrpH
MHIHSCLSPCGDWGMSPRAIVDKSREAGLDIIVVCDHNSSENAEATMQAGRMAGVNVLPGMEICSKEEVHVVAIFGTLENALSMQEVVYAHLPGENDFNLWGDQIVVNEKDEVMGENFRLLIGATTMGLQDVVEKAHHLDGICIASHIDRQAFGIISNLGFIPKELKLDGLEVSWRMPIKKAYEAFSGIKDFPCITSSDAHYLEDIGKVWTRFLLEAPTFEEIRLALADKAGRRIEV